MSLMLRPAPSPIFKEIKKLNPIAHRKKANLMNEEIFDRLKVFVMEQAAVEAEEVTRDARIEDDLGVYGDDALDLLIAYGKAFNVDVTKFMAADYFSGEGDSILPRIIRFLANGKKRKTFTVGHLEKGIIAGRLDEEIINS